MIFETVRIENLFSYRKAEFDLTGASPDRNIVLVSGRNGYGKTSFINCIKLLFVGANEDMRASVLSGRALTRRQYILGTTNDEWLGIMNRRARRAGEKNCEIRIIWRDSNDSLIEARRVWRIDTTDFKETLEVLGTGSKVLHDDDAREYLEGLLPQDYLPFFFFDGEQIQRLAESNRKRLLEQIERLLNISPIDTLCDYLDRCARVWRKDGMVEGEKSRLTELEGESNTLVARLHALMGRQSDLLTDIDKLTHQIQEEEHRLDRHRAANQEHDKKALTKEWERLTEELERAQYRVAEDLPTTVPLLANPGLVKKAVAELRKLVENDTSQQAGALKEILDDLPAALFDKPPYSTPRLMDSQVRFYKHRLEKLLGAHIPPPENSGEGLLRMELTQARALLSVLDHFAQADQERKTQAQTLSDISRLKLDIRDVEIKLDDVGTLSEEEREDFQRRKAANDERKKQVGAHEREIEHIDKEHAEINRQIQKKAREIRDQERRVTIGARARPKVERAEQMRHFFRAYKDQLKQHKRGAIETAINVYFRALVTGHGLIRHIRVAEDFGIHFKDSEGQPVAMASLSAGLKQLTVTALLWALKEVSGKEIPLVIDTPLARIDRAHQENLLHHYYPKVGRQVIVLPTDSELDAEKYRLLAPHVYRQYRLDNPDGDDTQVIKETRYRINKQGTTWEITPHG
uniref:DNA sulfur modification protein DndD n=1 Tax=Candidatus Kentrum sp. FW TaxID=2126338 RepID=A0A450SQQ7_9GAMM|nr:MAG: DNA sulfur modification protein DndD [Candidatus Kentron sp. FW]